MTLQRVFQREYEKRTGLPYFYTNRYVRDFSQVDEWIEAVAKLHNVQPEDVAKKLCEGFFGDAWVQDKGYPVRALLNEPMRYYRREPAMTAEERDRKVGTLIGKINALASEIELATALGADTAKVERMRAHLDAYKREKRELERG